MKKAGNALMALVGGREVHPINVRVGGFYRAPTPRASCARCASRSSGARDALATVALGRRSSPFPEVERAPELVALARPGRLPDRPRRGSSPTGGLDIAPREFDEHIVEEHVEHSNALHARIRERGTYLTGPLARYSLSSDVAVGRWRARPRARPGSGAVCRNPFQSIVVRAVELVQACDEALAIIDALRAARRARRRGRRRARAVGHGATEAPRGLLYHRYEIDERRHDPRRDDRAADLAEPARDRGGPARGRRSAASTCPTSSCRCAASRRSATTTRASPARPTS